MSKQEKQKDSLKYFGVLRISAAIKKIYYNYFAGKPGTAACDTKNDVWTF